MAKPRKTKADDNAKTENSNSQAVVRHQKLCLSIDIEKRRIYGFVSSSALALSFLVFAASSVFLFPNISYSYAFMHRGLRFCTDPNSCEDLISRIGGIQLNYFCLCFDILLEIVSVRWRL